MMKRTLKIVAVMMVAIMLCLSLASCGTRLSGKYVNDATAAGTGVVTTYDFSGSKVEITVETKFLGSVTGTVTLNGKYSIDDDKITFEFEDEDNAEYSGTKDFEKTDDGIKIGIVEYKKK